MNKELYIFNKLHKKTSRDYIARMVDDKVHCMEKAKEYEFDYWDGDRRYGYGGYKYDGRWKEIAQDLINQYNLTNTSKVLDVGCGKAFLIYELTQLLPGISVEGFDISKYGISDAKDEVKDKLYIHRAQDSIFGKAEYARRFLWNTYSKLYYGLATNWNDVDGKMNTGMFECLSDCFHSHNSWDGLNRHYYSGTYTAVTEDNTSETRFGFTKEETWSAA